MTLQGPHRFIVFFLRCSQWASALVHLGRSRAGEPFIALARSVVCAAIGLIVYGVWFYRKNEKVGIIT